MARSDVALDANDAAITYTLDGSIPTRRSAVYGGPLPINRTTTLRFRAFRDGWHPEPGCDAYLHHRAQCGAARPVGGHGIQSISWSLYTGIYDNPNERGSEWQRAAHIEALPAEGGEVIRFPAEIRIHGKSSRGIPKKSFRFTSESTSIEPRGVNSLWHPRPGESTRTMVLRTGGDYRLRNELFQTLFEEVGGIGSPATLYVVLLNGENWGLTTSTNISTKASLPGTLLPANTMCPRTAMVPSCRATRRPGTNSKRSTRRTTGLTSRPSGSLQNGSTSTTSRIIGSSTCTQPTSTGRTTTRCRFATNLVSIGAGAGFPGTSTRRSISSARVFATTRRPGLCATGYDMISRFNNHKGLQDRDEFVSSTLLMRQLVKNTQFRRRLAARMRYLLDTTL